MSKIICLAALLLLSTPFAARAHSALMNCFDNGDETFTCQGGFSDGSSATGIEITVRDAKGNVLQKAKMDANSEVIFSRPAGDFTVFFDGGPGHSVEVDGKSLAR
ncbi:MAG: hypothetical protein IJT59_03720 [Desulfovibrionaceae bacterium]|nr:hypothetical protein [Desulfovibrionaceae bacterium]